MTLPCGAYFSSREPREKHRFPFENSPHPMGTKKSIRRLPGFYGLIHCQQVKKRGTKKTHGLRGFSQIIGTKIRVIRDAIWRNLWTFSSVFIRAAICVIRGFL
jgi:ribosome biogenesis protein Nip4